VEQDGSKPSHYATSITASNPIDSVLEPSNAPYEADLSNATALASTAHAHASPKIPPGKATAQAIGSREQVLQDRSGCGASVIAEETAEEEREVKAMMRRSPRKRAEAVRGASSSVVQAGGLKGLRERVAGSGFHGRTGGVLGYESSR
ncbi:MAG: hypothetical protein ACRYGR_01450, partial [Janthinobacterium lividum]